jgi:hypothetical protein
MGGRMKMLAPRLDAMSDDVLLARVVEMAGRSRRVEAELVWHLAEVDRRRLYLREACPSMHVYATARLHLSDAEAYLRITAARLVRRFPLVLSMLADGKVHLSAIAKLAPHLTEDNAKGLLGRAAHRSKREIELLVAEIAPRPDVPSRMRRLPSTPAARAPVGAAASRPDGVSNCAVAYAVVPSDAATPTATPTAPVIASCGAPTMVTEKPAPTVAAAAVVAPLAPSRYRVQFTAGAELHDKIERARGLLRHQVPDGDLAVIFDRAMTLLVEDLERDRFAATRAPRKAVHEADPTPSSRRIPDPIKRAVWVRDEERRGSRVRERPATYGLHTGRGRASRSGRVTLPVDRCAANDQAKSTTTGAWSDGMPANDLGLRASRSRSAATARRARGSVA